VLSEFCCCYMGQVSPGCFRACLGGASGLAALDTALESGAMDLYFQDKQDAQKPTAQPPSLENLHSTQNEAALKSFCTSPPWDPYTVLPLALTMVVFPLAMTIV